MLNYKSIRECPEYINSLNSKDNITLTCDCCNNSYSRNVRETKRSALWKNVEKCFCSRKCQDLTRSNKIEIQCKECSVFLLKQPSALKKSKNHFCSQSCAVTFNNRNKTYGTRRSKLEIWLEEQLTSIYDFDIHFNKKDAIGSELDIYIPHLKLAFELNGIFHYEPIFGTDKLDQIQNNDSNKFQKCQEQGISLCIIDTSGQKSVNTKSSTKFLDIIRKIID